MSGPEKPKDDDGLDPGMLPPEIVPYLRPYSGPGLRKPGENPELDQAIEALREFERQEVAAMKAAEEAPAPASEVVAYIAPVALPKSHERTQEMLRVRVAPEVVPGADASSQPKQVVAKGPHDTARMKSESSSRLEDEDSSAGSDDSGAVVPRAAVARPTVKLETAAARQQRTRTGAYAAVVIVALLLVIGIAFVTRSGHETESKQDARSSAMPTTAAAPSVAPSQAATPTAAPAVASDAPEVPSASVSTPEITPTSKPRTPPRKPSPRDDQHKKPEIIE
jgi:hypothetical protein